MNLKGFHKLGKVYKCSSRKEKFRGYDKAVLENSNDYIKMLFDFLYSFQLLNNRRNCNIALQISRKKHGETPVYGPEPEDRIKPV